MPITAQASARPKLNLPPLRVRDGGTIDAGELSRLLEALDAAPSSDEELQVAVSALDVDQSGKISWSEFRSWWSSR